MGWITRRIGTNRQTQFTRLFYSGTGRAHIWSSNSAPMLGPTWVSKRLNM